MTNRSDTFGRLLKGAINSIATYESKTAPIIEEELAAKVHLAGSAIQWYKAGYLPPDPHTVEIIAEAAVRRGYLNRDWLRHFLHAARYPNADRLIEQLCPSDPVRPRPPRVYQNLPPPTYSQFVMRKEAFAEVMNGLGRRSAAVVIMGLGGNGKTSLAREVAASCLKSDGSFPTFDAAVWVSDKDRPGTTNLSIVLDEIARILNYPDFMQFEHDEKRYEVEQLLRRQRVLVCVDNFETITDGALLSWLLTMPEPSKTLITTREYRREYRRGGWPVELRGMSDTEARELVNERLRVLRIEKLVTEGALLEPLVVATGGNPKAIEITLGIVKYERRPLQQVVDDLHVARGELFDDLFTRAWALLDDAARRILLVMTFFPASASGEALGATADVQRFAFDRAVERLADLALLDVQQADLSSLPRYTLHPLVRAFAGAKMMTEYQRLATEAREQWVRWYSTLAIRAEDPVNFPALQFEADNLVSVIQWLTGNGRMADAVEVFHRARHLLFAEGRWEALLRIADEIAVWAEASGEPEALDVIIDFPINIFRQQKAFAQGQAWLDRIQLAADRLKGEQLQASVWLAQGRLLYSQDDFSRGEEFVNKALNIFRKYNNLRKIVQSLNSLGNLYLRAQKYTDATGYYQDALKVMSVTTSQMPDAFYWNTILRGNIGITMARQKRYEEARTILNEIEGNLTDQTDFAETYAVLALCEYRLGNRQRAYELRKKVDSVIERLCLPRPICEEDAEWMQIQDQPAINALIDPAGR